MKYVFLQSLSTKNFSETDIKMQEFFIDNIFVIFGPHNVMMFPKLPV